MNAFRQHVRTSSRKLKPLFGSDKAGKLFAKVLPLACVLLILLVSVAEASHAHPDGSKLSQHSCSICSAAHNGVRIEKAYVPSPLVAHSEMIGPSNEVLQSLLVIRTICIRPPPIA